MIESRGDPVPVFKRRCMENEITELNKAIAKAESETELENLLKDLQGRKDMAERDRISIYYQMMIEEFMNYAQILDAEEQRLQRIVLEKQRAAMEQGAEI